MKGYHLNIVVKGDEPFCFSRFSPLFHKDIGEIYFKAKTIKDIRKNVSIFRNEDSLRTAKAELEILKKKFLRDTKCSGIAEYEFKNMLLVSELIIQAALTREESRGAHYRTDFLTENDVAEHSQLINEKGELVFVK